MSSDTSTLVAHISSNTFTVVDVQRRVGLLRECLETTLFHESETSIIDALTTCLRERGSQSDASAVIAWGEPFLLSFTQKNIAEQIVLLHLAIDALPILTLYIPTEFGEEELTMLGQWCRSECDASLLLDIHIDPNVAGGCSFVWQDRVHDFSFHNKLAQHKGLITSMLSEYA